MGYSLRPTAEVLRWLDEGADFMNGASYWAPVDRALVYLVPSWTRVPAEEDSRILSNLVLKDPAIGAIGFSPVAEAYFNFGVIGVVIVMFLVGMLLGWMEAWPVSPERLAILGIVMNELLFNIRNNFTPVPSHIVLGMLFLLFIKGMAHIRPAKHKIRPQVQSHYPEHSIPT
jgi:hypothetical protein